MPNNSSISTKDGKIIFVSDLEGCAEFSTTSQFGPYKSSLQSQVLCSSQFFERLDEFLSEEDKNNKVAFLGDYFDKGPMALQSITSIVDLYDKHNISGNKKVYIILGNRDLNKLRLPYELQDEIIGSCSSNSNTKSNQNILRWETWKKFYTEFLKPENVTPNERTQKPIRQNAMKENNVTIPAELKKKLEVILELSMGAIDNPKINVVNKITKINTETKTKLEEVSNKQNIKKIKDNAQQNKKDVYNSGAIKTNILEKTLHNLEGILIFNRANNGNITVGFCEVVRKLFEFGTIVEYDETYKVLMSHAGGMDETIFNKIKKTDNLLTVFSKSTSGMDYFSRIEWFRLELTNPLSNIYNNNNNNKLSIQYLCDSINYLLDEVKINTSGFSNFSQKLSNSNSKKTICPEYYLLQAMGLKGDPGKPFASFVESCDTPDGCGGPKDSSASYSAFLKELKEMGVDVISCGHIPQCIPMPLIYKRQTYENGKLDPIVFILNDTSNGYRPENIDNYSKVPLSFIEKMGNTTHVGVGLFDNSRMIECNLENHLRGKNTSTMKPENKKFACQLEGNNLNKFIKGTEIENKHSKESTFFKPGRWIRSVSGRDRRYSRQNFIDSGSQPLLLLRNLKQRLNVEFDGIVSKTPSLKEYEVLLGTWNIKSKNFPYFTKHTFVNKQSKVIHYKLKMKNTYLRFTGGYTKPKIIHNPEEIHYVSNENIGKINENELIKSDTKYVLKKDKTYLGKYLGTLTTQNSVDTPKYDVHRFAKLSIRIDEDSKIDIRALIEEYIPKEGETTPNNNVVNQNNRVTLYLKKK
jgi:hypothetical protein